MSDFLTETDAFSLREAASMSGLNHETIAQLRRGERPRLQPATLRKMRAYLAAGPRQESSTVSHGTIERAVALLAAERLEQMAGQLRREALDPAPPHELTKQARRAGKSVLEVRTPKPQKRAGRKGG